MIRTAASSRLMWGHRARTLALFVVGVLVAASIGLLVVAKDAHAKTFSVNSMEDAFDMRGSDGECATEPFQPGFETKCTLRAAIQQSNFDDGTDTINFASVLKGTITLSLGKLEIANDTSATDLDIQGPGARTLTVSANDASEVFRINQDTDVTISGLTISDGAFGGGILNRGGILELNNTTVSGNSSFVGGGILNDSGTVELTNSTVSGNTATEDASAGGILNGGTTTNPGTLKLTNTTVSNNSATDSDSLSGGILNAGTMELTNSTVSGNQASGSFSSGGISNTSNGTATLTNTIVARNTATTNPDAEGEFTSRGNNLIGDTTGATGFGSSDLLNVNPLLGRLQNYGGPTNTRALLPGSPAVDAGANASCPLLDQRGVLRIDGDGNGTVVCDIGAFERNDLTPPKLTTTSPTGGETGVERNTNLTATFSEKMDRATLSTSTFKLFKIKSDGTTTQIADVSVSSTTNGLNATLNPDRRLGASTEYKAVVTTGAKDRAGNRLDQNPTATGSQSMVWTFTTGS